MHAFVYLLLLHIRTNKTAPINSSRYHPNIAHHNNDITHEHKQTHIHRQQKNKKESENNNKQNTKGYTKSESATPEKCTFSLFHFHLSSAFLFSPTFACAIYYASQSASLSHFKCHERIGKKKKSITITNKANL